MTNAAELDEAAVGLDEQTTRSSLHDVCGESRLIYPAIVRRSSRMQVVVDQAD